MCATGTKIGMAHGPCCAPRVSLGPGAPKLYRGEIRASSSPGHIERRRSPFPNPRSTHLHQDHTVGLNAAAGWRHGPLYCSPITARLLPTRFPGVDASSSAPSPPAPPPPSRSPPPSPGAPSSSTSPPSPPSTAPVGTNPSQILCYFARLSPPLLTKICRSDPCLLSCM